MQYLIAAVLAALIAIPATADELSALAGTLSEGIILDGEVKVFEPSRPGCWSDGSVELCVTADACRKVIAAERVPG